jgi:hypothetical protein
VQHLFSMAKLSKQQTQKNNNANSTINNTKVKRTRRSVPRDSPIQRSSIYRGVTRLVIVKPRSFHYISFVQFWGFRLQAVKTACIQNRLPSKLIMRSLIDQAQMDRSIWSSFVGQELLERITKQERTTRFMSFLDCNIYNSFM